MEVIQRVKVQEKANYKSLMQFFHSLSRMVLCVTVWARVTEIARATEDIPMKFLARLNVF